MVMFLTCAATIVFGCTMHGGVGIGDASYLVLVIDGSNTLQCNGGGVGPKAICYTDVLRDIS